ncbi:putative COP9 signalosome complex subunit 2 [Microstroma glucosiphilum]|uniref:COP9 signalosome complex subunit 2 n=1 Tax=Pseudomicrostroma glucosiphilum TaxID=1684307 RepID=A0A316U6Z7_9BASI|nr:putative COP9 signalosome complex subunit 2 [Pseudomicrostroma glucosiphilum]PWN20211.1 putative COP9 signalosome complex subunit 2 [Pseudomicrostroma glucosiphilum]
MSDDDEFLMDDAADEDYDFDYEEDEEEDEADADIENMYYNAKAKKAEDADAAIKDLRAVVDKETQKGDWGFKALKQMTKINFHRNLHDKALETYTELLAYTKSAVTRNYSEKSINNILDYVSNASNVPLETMEKFYAVTNSALEEAKNERLSTKTDLKLARLWLARGEWGRLGKTLKELRAYCTTSDGTDDQSKGTILLEIFALEIQMYSEMGNFKRLKATYDATLQVKSAIPHPRIMGVIRECGGKMHMAEKNWTAAQVDFFQAFLMYDEAGSPQRISVLKYLVLSHMLMGSEIDPFDSQETKPYKNDPQIVAMTNLVGAYQRREVHEAERILRENKATIMEDSFIRAYIDDVLKGLRTQYLIDLIKPYTRMELSFLSRQLNISTEMVEELLMSLILDGTINGRIDGLNQRLELKKEDSGIDGLSKKRYEALDKWCREVNALGVAIEDKHTRGSGGGVKLRPSLEKAYPVEAQIQVTPAWPANLDPLS